MSQLSRAQKLRFQVMGADLTPVQAAELITATTNSVLGDESLLEEPFKSLAAELLGFLATRNETNVEAANVVQKALPNGKLPTVSLGELSYGAGTDLIGKYQHAVPSAPDYPAHLTPEMAEDTARHVRSVVEGHLAENYNTRYGSIE